MVTVFRLRPGQCRCVRCFSLTNAPLSESEPYLFGGRARELVVDTRGCTPDRESMHGQPSYTYYTRYVHPVPVARRLPRVPCRDHVSRLRMPIIRALQNTSSSSSSLMLQPVLLLRAFIATNNPPATLCLGLKLCRRGTLPSALLRPVPAFAVFMYVKDGTRVRSVLAETAVEDETERIVDPCETARGRPLSGVGLPPWP